MKRLYLLRHAKSSWDDPSLGDHDRPLAKRGRKAAKRMGRHLGDEGIEPDLVLCSTSARTRQTLERLGLEAPIEFEDGLYAASTTDLLERLHALPEDVGSVMVIGHNPAIEDLTLMLSGTRRDKFPTAAMATLEFDAAWGDLSPDSADLAAFVRPKDLQSS